MATPLSSSTIPVPPKSLIFLHEWWLVNQCKGLAVGGVASDGRRGRERVFLSTVIAEREEANVLHTQDGITILFRGFINVSRSCQNGVSSEVCQHFLIGFPHDWKNYSPHSFGDEDIHGVTAFADSSGCSKKRLDHSLPFSIRDHDFTNRQDSTLSNNCLTPIKICNGLGISFGNDSKQSESTDNIECECKDNGEKGISAVAVESQAENPKSGQSLMGTDDTNLCTGPSRKSPVKPPTSTKKMKKVDKNASNSCSRMVTRSMSKINHTMPKEDEKATVARISTPVRRSPRLYSCR